MPLRPSPRSLTAAVLKQVRDSPGLTGRELAKALDAPFEPPQTSAPVDEVYVVDALEGLERASLIEGVGAGEATTFRTTRAWSVIQRTLKLSLSELVLRHAGGMTVSPIFGSPPRSKYNQRTAFVAIPFAQSMKPVYTTIEASLLGLDILPLRGDDLFHVDRGGHVMEEIWSAMCASDVVIADCTGKSANVMYELGMAHTLGKPVLLLTQSKEDVPFDVGHLRFTCYAATRDGLEALRLEIRKQLLMNPSFQAEKGE
jgi:hypothetical protein